jgi:hypothetical protein
MKKMLFKKGFCTTRNYILGLNFKDNQYIDIGVVDLNGNIISQKSHKLKLLNIKDDVYINKIIALRARELFN